VLTVATVSSLHAGGQTAATPAVSATATPATPPGTKEAAAQLMQQPLHFEAVAHGVQGTSYIAEGPGFGVALSSTRASIVLLQPSARPAQGKRTARPSAAEAPLQLDLTLIGASSEAHADPMQPLTSTSNYFIGSDPAAWRTSVAQFGRLRFAQVYPGIDVVYYGNGGRLEHDFVVRPGADLSCIRLHFSGPRPRLDKGGDLILSSGAGEVRLLKPEAYQLLEGSAARQPITSSFRIAANGDVSFSVGAFDRARSLTIDPAIAFATYFGSTGDNISGVAVDAAGNIYLTGEGYSFSVPAKDPLFTAGTGLFNVFVSELDPTGSTLLFSTFLGGNSSDSGNAIALDSKGNIYLTGLVTSTNFPVLNAAQEAPGGVCAPETSGCGNAFVTAIKSGGKGLIYSTYLGGNNYDSGNSIAVDSKMNAYVTGTAGSEDFPLVNPLQKTFAGAFVTKYNSTGKVQYSTYLGGNSDDDSDLGQVDGGNGIAVDTLGAAYVTGHTLASNFPVTNPILIGTTAIKAGAGVWVAKINPAGPALVYSDSIAGGGTGNAIAVDSTGGAYVTGIGQLPLTAGTYSDSAGSAFVFKLTPAGTAFVYSARLGGNSFDTSSAIAVDSSGDAWIAGDTYSTNFPMVSAIQNEGGGLMAVSEDGGTTFGIRNAGLLNSGQIYSSGSTAVLIDPTNAGSLLVGQAYSGANPCTATKSSCGGIFQSVNGGFNWTRTKATGLTKGPSRAWCAPQPPLPPCMPSRLRASFKAPTTPPPGR
jgi:hypothetical protein